MYARISALLVAFALAVTSLAAAQERFGNITGKVTDQTGAVLPGVTVTVTNNETQRSTVVVSDSNGTFYATALDPGRYAVKFELSGFITQEAPSVILLLGTTATVDSSLRVGGVTETVQVLAGTPLIDVASTTHQKNIPAEEFEVIPKGRSFQALATALPSVNAGELEGGFQVNGASAGENNFTVDGVSVVSQIHGNQRQDAVFEYLQEVQVKTSGSRGGIRRRARRRHQRGHQVGRQHVPRFALRALLARAGCVRTTDRPASVRSIRSRRTRRTSFRTTTRSSIATSSAARSAVRSSGTICSSSGRCLRVSRT